jgi:hypothetical protein
MLKSKYWFALPILFAMPAAAQSQLIVNGGFENASLTPWATEGALTSGIQTFVGQVGSFGAILSNTQSDAIGRFSQSFNVTTAGIYGFSFLLGRGESACGCNDVPLSFRALVDDFVLDATVPGSVTSVPFFAQTTRYDRSATLGVGTHRLAFEFSRGQTLFGRAPFFVLDDVGVTLTNAAPGVPEPASWAMMIAGFGLAGAASRRRKALVTA